MVNFAPMELPVILLDKITSTVAAIAEVLHYYVDNMARETFLSTARRYDSVVKHGALVDYHARAAIAANKERMIIRMFPSE